MEQLRAERLKRETEERKKAADLMAKLRGETIPEKKETVELSDINKFAFTFMFMLKDKHICLFFYVYTER
jgi:hypothetical protein